MDVSVAEAKNHLPRLIRAFEQGEPVVITRNGKPVAQLARPPATRREVRFGTMRGRIGMKPGWDKPINLDQFLAGEFARRSARGRRSSVSCPTEK
jgi:antitoxin (DNA-binding transcriptional repressor) of toxin-antitoxin stability system